MILYFKWAVSFERVLQILAQFIKGNNVTAPKSGRRLQVPYDNYFNTALQLNHGSRRLISAQCYENQYYYAKFHVSQRAVINPLSNMSKD